MMSAKRIADMGYRMFSGSMMVLTLYGGYMCTARAYRFWTKEKVLEVEAQEQREPEMIKD